MECSNKYLLGLLDARYCSKHWNLKQTKTPAILELRLKLEKKTQL